MSTRPPRWHCTGCGRYVPHASVDIVEPDQPAHTIHHAGDCTLCGPHSHVRRYPMDAAA